MLRLLRLLPLLLLPLTTVAQTVTITQAPTIPSDEPTLATPPILAAAVLDRSNAYRAEHNASALAWNKTLARYAHDFLARSGCVFAHSGGPYGENLALGCGDAPSCVAAWGDERDHYDFGRGEFGEATGHFTQLVWKATTATGCAARLCPESGWFLACEYWPRGNVVGAFRDEVQGQGQGQGDGSGAAGPARGRGPPVWALALALAVVAGVAV